MSEKPGKNKLDIDNWVDNYGDYLYNYAFSRLRDKKACEDVVQETFLAALRNRESYAGDASEKTWLTGILRHKIFDHLRKLIREKPIEMIENMPDEVDQRFIQGGPYTGHWDYYQAPVDWGKNPESFLEQKEFQEVLQYCLGKLSERIAGVFMLYQIEGYTAEEICKEIGLSSTNLWVMLHRARRQLRQCLEDNWFKEEKPDLKRKNKSG
jgi:RNA polymerase sigma-70 factor (ECF subfamily)